MLQPVDEIVLGAPKFINDDLLERFKVDIVARGLVTSTTDSDRFAVAKKRGILRIVDSRSNVTTQTIVDRILKTKSSSEHKNSIETSSLCNDVFYNEMDNSFTSQYSVQQQG
ncbi:unnamed protein product [Strongylus vulgaris]|uniref:Cytidyltransferase-like domain-containing protein n=1 Tax=Strongylus vulgaris TaxID=40348 RepID=A0A3P7L5Q1_STRVU|nr:unnamed protein product [Strongylus vulgaris]